MVDNDEGFLPDPGFAFDADGNMYDVPTATPGGIGSSRNQARVSRGDSDLSALAQARRDSAYGEQLDMDVRNEHSLETSKLLTFLPVRK